MSTATPHQIKRMGWRRQLPDVRDHVFSAYVTTLPAHVDLHAMIGPVWDQGEAGSCTGNGTAAAIKYDRVKSGETPDFVPSRLLLYYDGRQIEGTQGTDAGAAIRDVVKAAATSGVCPETDWPYDLNALTTQPSTEAYAAASPYKVSSYQALQQNLSTMKSTLAAGYVFVFGFTVYSSFMTDRMATTGLMWLPQSGDRAEGGHCVCAVGYNSKNYIMCRNSWGTGWGDPDYPGHFWMPASYITNPNLASDFWVVQTITS
jgi:C1A family cysteine protease